MDKKKNIYWVIGILLLLALLLIISHYTGLIDFKELFIAGGDQIPSSGGVAGSGGAVQ